jgi:hypothetical protein
MRLARRYSQERLEAACERASHLRSYSYRTVQNILVSAQDRLPFDSDSSSTNATLNHGNIRGADYYAAPQEDEC